METEWFFKLDIKKQLILASLLGGFAAAVSIISFQNYLKRNQIKQIKAETIQVDWSSELEKENQEKFIRQGQEVLINEQLSRNIAFLGKEGISKLRHSFVIVVGLGGVGSHAAHMLCRAGVEHIRLIDFDQVTLSSLNRHAVATREDVGIPKVIAMKNHLLKTVPYANIDAKVKLFKLEAAQDLLSGKPDYVLDCIDHLPTKIQLIEYCVNHNIEIISSMGAGAKADPSRIQISGINDTFEDPLARYFDLNRSVRQSLKKRGVKKNITVAYSTEKPSDVKLLPLNEENVDDADQYASLPSFRSRILPVLGTIPALFGNAMASHVITELSGFKTEPLAVKGTKKTYLTFYKELVAAERIEHGEDVQIYLSAEDLGFIFDETWNGRSALSKVVNQKLVLVKWDPTKRADFGNMICLTKSEAARHLRLEQSDISAHYDTEFLGFVQSRFYKERTLQAWRT